MDTKQTGSPLYLLGSRSSTNNKERKDGARPQLSNRNQLRVPSRVNDNYCVQSAAGLKDSVYVSGKLESRKEGLDQQHRDCKFTCKLFCVNVHFLTRLSQKKGVIPFYCHN